MTVSLRPYRPPDRFLLHRWLGEPDVIAWFGSRGAADAEIALAHSSPSSFLRVILFAGVPIGYAQAFDMGLSGLKHPAIPSGSFDADVFIGSMPHRGHGYGAQALRLLADEVFAATLAVSVAITVPLRNEAAVRRIERAGFKWHAVIHDALLGPLWILRRDRAAT